MENTFFLMHKNIIVASMQIDENGGISKIRKNPDALDHIPLGAQMNDMKFHEWWNDRAIPKSRHGVKNALQKLGYASTNNALVNNLALSLSDCYWIKPINETASWEDVNLFTNDFVDSFGDITINRDHIIDLRKKTKFDCASSQGELQKKWCIDKQGKRYLVKGNYGNSYQQSINEVFASQLHKQQGFKNYSEYTLTKLTVDGNSEGLGCLCYDYCSGDVESISAWELLQTKKYKPNEIFYSLKEICISLGMPESEFDSFMDYEILTDYLLSNTDRHMNNIAILRNPDTLKIIGFAPIYDSGNSMFYEIPYEKLQGIKLNEIITHSFFEKEPKLLKLVKNRNAVDLDKAQMDFSIYEQDLLERRSRIPKLKELYQLKLDRLAAFQAGK